MDMVNEVLRVAFLIVLTLAVGCSTIEIPRYSGSEVLNSGVLKEEQGLRIRIDPFVQPERVTKYFGMNSLEKGVVPVYICATNTSDKASFLLLTDQFKLAPASTPNATVGAANSITNPAPVSAGFSVATTLILPLWSVLVAKENTDTEAIEHNFVRQELLNETLSPGKSISGFVYFVIQGAYPPDSPATVVLPVRIMQTDQILTFDNH